MRLVDIDAINLKDVFIGESDFAKDIRDGVQELLDNAPAVDAVPVVRCKDCIYWGDEDRFLVADDGKTFGRCTIHNYMIDGVHTGWCPKEDCFCSIGERKDEVSE